MVLGTGVSAALLTAAGRLLDLPIGPAHGAALGLLVFGALEVRDRRADAVRLRAGRALLAAVAARLGPDGAPEAGWARGMPYLRGRRGGTPFTLHLETAGLEHLRVGVAIDAEPAEALWIASGHREGFPARWFRKLERRHRHVPVAGVEPLVALGRRPIAAAELLARPGVGEAVRALVEINAPCAAVLDLQPGGLGWDSLLTPRLDAGVVLGVVDALIGLAAQVSLDASDDVAA